MEQKLPNSDGLFLFLFVLLAGSLGYATIWLIPRLEVRVTQLEHRADALEDWQAAEQEGCGELLSGDEFESAFEQLLVEHGIDDDTLVQQVVDLHAISGTDRD